MTTARVLPDHTHNVTDYSYAPHCPACMALGLVNADTGTPFPSLTDEDEELIQAGADRFSDRYDGTNHETALEAALTEVLHRAKMRGRYAEVAHAKTMADRREAEAHDAAQTVVTALAAGDTIAAQRAAEESARLLGTARALRVLAGGR